MRWILLLSFPLLVLAGCASPVKEGEISGEPNQTARKLYLTKCAKCHKLYDPAKYSDNEWQMWMAKMSRKAKLSPEQKELLSNYIEQTFRSGNH